MTKLETTKWPQLMLLILAGESIFFLPFVIARVFRPTFLSVFEINNLELGALYSIYGVIAMGAYFFGGPLADRFATRLLISLALVLTGLGGIVMAFAQTFGILTWLYGFWGITTILLFWSALIKATRYFGGNNFQSRAFGFLDGGRGFIAAFASSLAVMIYAYFQPVGLNEATLVEQQAAFKFVIVFFSLWVIIIGVLAYFFIDEEADIGTNKGHVITLSQVKSLINKRNIWFQSIIIICAYVGYKITDDFSLLAKDLLGYSDVESAQVGTLALWIRVVTAIATGIIADKVGESSKVISWGFLLTIAGGLILGTGVLPNNLPVYYLTVIIVTSVGVYGVRSLYFTLVQEASISTHVTGTAVGIISVVGFTPDVFMGPLMGYILDTNPGAYGHQLIFLVLSIFSFIGWLATLLFRRSK